MANWREDYYAALVARDEREQANSSLYDACTETPNNLKTVVIITNNSIRHPSRRPHSGQRRIRQ
jgi:hypothetical protein